MPLLTLGLCGRHAVLLVYISPPAACLPCLVPAAMQCLCARQGSGRCLEAILPHLHQDTSALHMTEFCPTGYDRVLPHWI